jgi:CPA2 family monovalent cation:H+ antiporter-2
MLLFQDVALVPIMLFIPVLSGSANAELLTKITNLFVVATLFVAAVYVLRKFIARKLVPLLISLRSTELVVLFAVIVLTGACWLASLLQMPAAVGALAAGFMLSGNRLTHQIDTLVLPFRETFSAVFFVTLGALLEPNVFLAEPLTISVTLVAVILIKALAAGFALKLTGLRWRQAMGTGLGLSQLGEFSFLIVGVGVAQGVFTQDDYQRTLVIAIGTLVLTPQLIKFGLRWGHLRSDDGEVESDEFGSLVNSNRAVVIGVGLIGGKTAARLETLGVEVCLVDRSPLNLYPFAQQGFQTVTGDAMDDRVIERVCPVNSQIAVVSVPDDSNAIQIVARLRTANPSLFILVRCRYFSNMSELKKAGANQVVSEERETSVVVTQICERLLWQSSDEPERGM